MPTKVINEELDDPDDSTLMFEFYLADKLKMTVQSLRENMSNYEFLSWQVYHAKIAQRMELERMKAGV